MFFFKLASRIVPGLLASLAFAAATGAQAYEGKQEGVSRTDTTHNVTCNAALQSARFEFERQRTEGNVNPFFQATSPAECSPRMASDAKTDGDAKVAVDANRAPVVLR